MLISRPAVLLLLAVAFSITMAAEAVPSDAPEQLLKQLPNAAGVVSRDGKVFWQADITQAVPIVGVDEQGNPQLETAIGKLGVMRRLVAKNRADAQAALPKLLAVAQVAKLEASGLVLSEGPLTGLHLRSAEVIVLNEGVLRKVAVVPADRGPEKQRVVEASKALEEALPGTALNDMGRNSVADVMQRLGQVDGKQTNSEAAPSFARRLIRHGWLRNWFTEPVAVIALKRLEQAVVEAERFQPVRQFTGEGLCLAEVADAFGRSGWIITTPTRSACLQVEAEPLNRYRTADLYVVIELPPGSDPIVSTAKAMAASIFADQQRLGSWQVGKGLMADVAVWRQAIPSRGPGVVEHAVTDFIPPHLLIAGLNGDVTGLAVAGGLLVPVQDASKAEADRFIADAARLLPAAADLDLVGEYLFTYAYPSPDSRFPHLIGNRRLFGDVQQTAYQTLANTTGGICRGDCVDIAELYQVIAERQGRNPIVIGLQGHAACCWAEKRGEDWHTYLLQTGQPLEFANPKLPAALEATYKQFDNSITFDPNGLDLLLRFSGEGTRSEWRLSWRIFSEPDYARTMIDVQRDWHFQTYQRGIAKMRKLIANGDDDNANYRELSGLYAYTGQYDLAVEYKRKAIDRTQDPVSRFYLAIELIRYLRDASREDEAVQLAKELIEHQFPALQEQLGASRFQAGLNLAGSLCGYASNGIPHPDLAVRVIKNTVQTELAEKIGRITAWLDSPKFNQQAWENDPQLEQTRHLADGYAAVAIWVLHDIGPTALPGNADLQAIIDNTQQWLNKMAFRDIIEPSDVMGRYATAGWYYGAVFGTKCLDDLLEQTGPPVSPDYQHGQRIGGAAQLYLDLPWIRISVPYWSMRLNELFTLDRSRLDSKEVARLGRHMAEAFAASNRLGIMHPNHETQAAIGALITALVAKDAAGVRQQLRYAAEKNNKQMRDDAAQWLGTTARFLDLEWYQQVIGIWKEELNYKPKYFRIAWSAAITKALQHALLVAKLAAIEFKDDPAFAEEYDFMRSLLAPNVPAQPVMDQPAVVPTR